MGGASSSDRKGSSDIPGTGRIGEPRMWFSFLHADQQVGDNFDIQLRRQRVGKYDCLIETPGMLTTWMEGNRNQCYGSELVDLRTETSRELFGKVARDPCNATELELVHRFLKRVNIVAEREQDERFSPALRTSPPTKKRLFALKAERIVVAIDSANAEFAEAGRRFRVFSAGGTERRDRQINQPSEEFSHAV